MTLRLTVAVAIAAIVVVTATGLLMIRRTADADASLDEASGRDRQPTPSPTQVALSPADPVAEPSVPSPATLNEQSRLEPNILASLGVSAPAVASPVWADEMEARILGHVALYPGMTLTRLEAQCQADACLVLMQAATAIDAFRFEFDEFAKANGFQSAVIGSVDGRGNTRIIILRR